MCKNINIESLGFDSCFFKYRKEPNFSYNFETGKNDYFDDVFQYFRVDAEHPETCETIASITGCIVDSFASFWDLDGESGDFTEIADTVLNEVGFMYDYKFSSKSTLINSFAIINRFTVNCKYRNQSLGSNILKPMINYFLKEEFGYEEKPMGIVLLASAYEFLDDKEKYHEMSSKLLNFYKKQGFTRIEDTNVMYLTEKRLNAKKLKVKIKEN